jgi:predicted transcriptional regulator
MGITKHELHHENINLLSTLLKALAHPCRIRIIEYLLKHGSSNNKTLVQELKLSQSNISDHIKELRAVNIVIATPYENSVLYTLNRNLVDELLVTLQVFFQQN